MGRLLMLDSGAYTAYTKGVTITLDEYEDFVRRYGHWFTGGIINLDVIGDGKRSYMNWCELRKRGINTIPVYHALTDIEWLYKYLDETDYIAIGNLALVHSPEERRRLLRPVFKALPRDAEGNLRHRLHALGLGSPSYVIGYPWYSADFTTVFLEAGFGEVFVPGIRRLEDGSLDLDFSRCFKLYVSARTQRTKGSLLCYRSLPEGIRSLYEQYFRGLGYTAEGFPSLVKGRVRQLISFDDEGGVVSGPQQVSLAHSRSARVAVNLWFWVEFTSRVTRPIVYIVPSNRDQVEALRPFTLNILVSYWYLKSTPPLMESIESLIVEEGISREGQSRETVAGSGEGTARVGEEGTA